MAEHGTPGRYQHGCRCGDCRAAMAARNGEWRRRVAGTEPPMHGTLHGYTSYRCRCDGCRAAKARYMAARRRR